MALLAARSRIFKERQAENPTLTLGRLLDQLVVYCSDQAHSSIDKAVLIVGCHIRKISSDSDCVMHSAELSAAVIEDRARGLIPFFLVATLGTTPTVGYQERNNLIISLYHSVHSTTLLVSDIFVKMRTYGCMSTQHMQEVLSYVQNINTYRMAFITHNPIISIHTSGC